MQELRLVPAAVGVWVGALCCLLWGPVWAGGALAVGAGACVLYKEYGQAILVAGLGAASTLGTQLRCVLASRWEQTGHAQGSVVGIISGQPRELASGGYLIRMNVDGYPAAMPVFMEDLPPHAVPGAHVEAIGRVGESTVPGVGTVTINGDIAVHAGPQGMARLADYVRTTFDQAVQAQVGEATRGLIPGMVLGDTSSQSDAEQQMYIDTGLSHLSAVSGSNVAIVTSAAVIATTLLRLGLRYRLAAATAALLLFAGLVGPDPSVLRASVTGLVGLTAVMASTRAEPIHALCFSIIGLVLVDPDLAVHYGFALSVAATAGIVALSPLLYRALAFTQWPDIVVRALAVAIAADIATMPIVALMAGQVSLVSVVANVLVAPVVPPITVLGLLACVLSLLPGGFEALVLWIVEPLAWWVQAVAAYGANLPSATVNASPPVVLVCYGWIVAGFLLHRPRVTFAVVAALLLGTNVSFHAARPIDPTTLRAHVVETKEDVEPIPAGTELVVVLEDGRPHRFPVVTTSGIPVLFPNRDGRVVLYADGTQRLLGP